MFPKLLTKDSWPVRYGAAMAAVAAGVLLRLFLTAEVGEGLPTYLTFFPFMMLAGLLGGFGPGVVTTAAFALVADYWLMGERGQFGAYDAIDAMSLAVFCGMGIFISVMMELYRRARQRAETYARQLPAWERHDVPPRPWSERLLLGGGLALSLGLLAVAGWQTHRSMVAIYDADRSVAHTYAVGEEADHLLSAFQDLQASARGYVLTGRDEYLQSFTATLPEPARRLAALKAQSVDNPEQVRRVAVLEELVAAKLAGWKAIIDARRTNGLEAAQTLIASTKAEAMTDEIRQQVEQVQQEEDRLLALRMRAKESSLRHTRQALLAGGTLSILILAAVFAFLVRENAWRREAEAEARRHRDHLQEIVAARTAELAQANETLGQQREWLQVTLHSIGDAVLAADIAGRVTFLNPMAQRLTGWSEPEALGQPVAQVYRTLNEHTGVTGEDIFARALREGRTVELANHTALVARDGRHIPIEDSAAPIRDSAGRTSGVVLVFHDVTARQHREEQLRRLNRTLTALSDSSRAMMHADSEEGYLKEVCRIVAQDCGHALVWIGFAVQDEAKTVRPVAHAGFDEGYLESLRISWADSERGRGPTGTAIRTGKPNSCPDMMSDPLFAPWREEAARRGYASSLVVPLLADGKAFGALSIYAKEPHAFAEDESLLLVELAADVSYCITALRLRADRARAERLGGAINSVNAVIHSTLDPAQILHSALTEAARAVECDTAAISFRRNGCWVVSHAHGMPPGAIGTEIPIEKEPHAELAIRTRQPVAIDDAFNDERLDREHMRRWGVRSVLVVPLITEHEAAGVLFLNFQQAPVAFDRLHLDFAAKLASSLALALENARLFAELRRELAERERAERRTELLASIAGELLSTDSPQSMVDGLCHKVLTFLDCQVFFNFLADGSDGAPPATGAATFAGDGQDSSAASGNGHASASAPGRLRLNAFAGIPAEEGRRIEWLDYGTAICGCVARDGCRIVAEDIATRADPRTELVKSYGLQAYACHPLVIEGRVLGTLSFGTRTRPRFSEEDLALMKAVTDHVAIAMERQRVQTALRDRAADLRRSNADLEQFAYVASHDLQEPLRAVGGYLRLLERRVAPSLDQRSRNFLEGAVEGAVRMERLIQDLLAYSRVGSRGGNFLPTDLEPLLKQVLGNLQLSVRATPVTITHDRLPTLTVDATQFTQLFQNLIGNALKFRSARPPCIHVGAEKQAAAWLFRVRDNGIGIDPEYHGKIFQLFQRLHTRNHYAGTGIGLAVCKKIVERHGGRIWVESQPGQGASFYFTIPDHK